MILKIVVSKLRRMAMAKGPLIIEQTCKNLALSSANTNARFESPDRKLRIIGHENFIMIIKRNSGQEGMSFEVNEFIAGSATQLNQVQSLSYDESKKELSVVDEITRETLIFSSTISGNIAPEKVLQP